MDNVERVSWGRGGLGADEMRLVEFVQKREMKLNGRFDGRDLYREMMREAVHDKDLTPMDVFVLSTAMEMLGGTGEREQTWVEAGTVSEGGLTRSQRQEMYRRARKFARNDPMGANLLRLLLTHIAGRGFDVHLRASPLTKREHPLQHRVTAYFGSTARMLMYMRKIIAHTLVNGELFAVNGPVDPAPGIGRPRKRLLLPDFMEGERLGDEFALNPVMLGWRFTPLANDPTLEPYGGWVPPGCVTRFTVHADWNDGVHGISSYYWLMKEMPRYTDLMDIRENTARAEQLVLYIRYLTNTAGGGFHEIPLRSGVMDENAEGVKWDNLSPTGKGRDATSDFDEIRNRLTQAQPFPSPMLTGDLRYAAQLGIMGFPTQVLEQYQDGFTVDIQRHVAITVGCEEEDVVVSWPFVDMRDRTKIIGELVDGIEKKVLPRKVYHERAGYDHEEMEAQLAAEREEDLRKTGSIVSAETIAPGATSPLGRSLGSALAGLGTPGAAIATGTPATAAPVSSSPRVEMSLPASVTSSKRADFIEEKGAILEGEMALGVDTGYALGGAIAVGGLRGKDIVVIGEVKTERLQVTGEVSLVSVCNDLRKRFPRLTTAYVSKDAPDATHALQEDGWTVYPIQESEATTWQRIGEWEAAGGRVVVSDRAPMIQGELDPDERDAKAGMHVTSGEHVRDAFRYLASGLIQRGTNAGATGVGSAGGAGEVPGGAERTE